MSMVHDGFDKFHTRLRSFYLRNFGAVVRSLRNPKLPANSNDKTLVHIGCGELNDKRYINIDARPMPHVHYVSQDLSLTQFGKGSVDLIYACHVIEHFSHLKLPLILTQWFDRLKKNGILRVAVPDFDHIVDIYLKSNRDITGIQNALMGGQDYPTNFHYSVFNQNHLEKILFEVGFKEVRRWEPHRAEFHSFKDWSQHPLIVNGIPYPISLNLEACK